MDKFNAQPIHVRIAVILVALAALGAGTYFSLVEEIEQGITAQTSKAKKAQDEAEKLEKQYGDTALLEALEKEEADLRAQLEANKELLPTEGRIPSLISALQREANDRGLKINKFKPGSREVDDYLARIPVEMTVETTYPVLISFFTALAQPGMRMMTVKDLKLKALPMKDFIDKTKLRDSAKVSQPLTASNADPTARARENYAAVAALLAMLDAYDEAVKRSRIEASFVVNAYSYTGRPLSPEELLARNKKKAKRRR